MQKIVVCQAGSLGQVQVMRLMYPNIDVIHLAGYLRDGMSESSVAVIDGYGLGYERTLSQICAIAPDMLFVHGDTPTATAIYKLVNAYKAFCRAQDFDKCTVIFGEHISALPEEPFEKTECDAILLGDPEPPALALCKSWMEARVKSWKDIPNICFRDETGDVIQTTRNATVVDLDLLPPAARDLVNLPSYPGTYYKLSARETSVLTARGCPWRCTFCGPAWHRAQQKPRFRFRSPESIVSELERVQRDHGIDDFMLDITTFNFSPRWARSVCELIIERGLKLNLKTHLRADHVDAELLAIMRNAGFWLIYLGIESANDRSLVGVKKQVTVKDIEIALELLHASGLKVVAEVMNLLFWEEDGKLYHEGLTEALTTLRFLRGMYRRGRIHAMYWAAMTPVPASESYGIALRHNLIPAHIQGQWHLWFPVQTPVARLPGISTPKWFLIQWAGKLHQAYFIMGSRLLHRSLFGLITQRAGQMIQATARAMRPRRVVTRPASIGS